MSHSRRGELGGLQADDGVVERRLVGQPLQLLGQRHVLPPEPLRHTMR